MSATLPILDTNAPREAASPPSAKPGILDVPADTLRAWLSERGQPPMRVNQIRRQILAARATTFEGMSDLPKQLRADLAESFSVFSMRVERHYTASDDTHKLVFRLSDDRMIEGVLIQDVNSPARSSADRAGSGSRNSPAKGSAEKASAGTPRATACISTQVGCGMGCVFCASGLNGVVRNLTSGEMLEQLVLLRNLTDPNTTRLDRAPRLTNVVVMGMGEPLANLENLLDALAVAGDKNGLCIGARHITISTVGLPAKIRKLAESGKQYHLAVSLHAPNDELRTRIVPTNDKTGMDAIMAAADEFYEKTGRQVTYEYVVLGGLNDQPHHARQLAGLLTGRQAHVNLIPWNAVGGLSYRRPQDEDLQYLIDTLRRSGISVKVRKRKGAEIDAACGQLRRSAEQEDRGQRTEDRGQRTEVRGQKSETTSP